MLVASLGLSSAGVVRAGWKLAQVGDAGAAVSTEHAEVVASRVASMPNTARIADALIFVEWTRYILRWSRQMPACVKARTVRVDPLQAVAVGLTRSRLLKTRACDSDRGVIH